MDDIHNELSFYYRAVTAQATKEGKHFLTLDLPLKPRSEEVDIEQLHEMAQENPHIHELQVDYKLRDRAKVLVSPRADEHVDPAKLTKLMNRLVPLIREHSHGPPVGDRLQFHSMKFSPRGNKLNVWFRKAEPGRSGLPHPARRAPHPAKRKSPKERR